MAEIFGQYQLLDKIAEGGMAELYLAKSSKFQGLEKYLIIKRILPKYSSSSDLIKMFINEAKVNMNMSHNNIVNIFDFGVEGGRFFIAMEYVQGQNLRNILKLFKKNDLKLTEADKLYVVTQAALGLDYAHRCKDMTTGKPLNIVHRDVSPDNIMVNLEGNVKIIDFGVAVDSEQHENKVAEGKFSYMSPEQAKADGNINVQTDVFAMGVVLWELIAGEKLYKAASPVETLELAKACEYRCVKELGVDINDELDRILRKSLAASQTERYQTMHEFYVDLNRYLNMNFPEYTVSDLKENIIDVCSEESTNIQRTFTEFQTQTTAGASVDLAPGEDRTMVAGESTGSKKRRTLRSRTIKRRRIKKVS